MFGQGGSFIFGYLEGAVHDVKNGLKRDKIKGGLRRCSLELIKPCYFFVNRGTANNFEKKFLILFF